MRADFAARYLRGSGIEIGALHLAMAMPVGVQVRYVDRMAVTDLREHYPELRDWDLAHVDVVDDGERLETIAPESVDFIVANHFLEHCEDPIGTIATHLGKLRPGGVLFYAVPDKRYTFDFRRERTPLQHHLDDHEHGAERSRTEHYEQWAGSVYTGEAPTAEQAATQARRLEAEGYSIHFHVWTHADLTALLLHIQERLGTFELQATRRNGIENIVVLSKRGTVAPAERPVATAGAPAGIDAAPPVTASDATPRTLTTPLSALRSRPDVGQADASWPVNPDGVGDRALLLQAGRTLTFPLRLPAPMSLTGRVRLLPHDWRDGRGRLTARVLVQEPGGERELWSAAVVSSGELGNPGGVEFACELPPSAIGVRLALDSHVPGERAVARAIWVGAALHGPVGIPAPRAAALPPAPPAAVKSGQDPLLSVLLPVHDPTLAMLREAIESVRGQTFTDWQLCLVDDGCRRPEIVDALREYACADPRIVLTRHEQARNISEATNAALALATGTYVALLDHDDWLGPDALAAVTARIAADPSLDMLYTDEDIVLDDRPVWVHLKPGWSPDTLRTNGYTCHLGVYRRALVQEIGGFRTAFNGSQDVDMILRFVERTDRVAHVPGIHYHWRIHPDSTAGGDAKPYAYVAARAAIAEHLERSGIAADVEYGPPGLYRVAHRVPGSCRVTLVLALDDASGVAEAARSWVEQPHRAWRVLLTGPATVLEAAVREARVAGVANHRIRTLLSDGLDRHAALAAAAAAADEDLLLLMQSPAAGLGPDWLTRLMGYAAQPGIGAAGPIQIAANGRIQEGGVAVPDGWPLPLLHGAESSMDRHFGYGTSVYDVSAVSGMLATSRAALDQTGPLRPEYAELMLVDHCLRAGDRDLRTVLVPESRLIITGEDRTMNDLVRADRLARVRWGRGDPYWNPGWRTDHGDFAATAGMAL